MRLLWRGLVGFFRFWYDFLVGDAWEIAAGVAFVLFAAVLAWQQQAVRASALPYLVGLAVVAVVALSVVWEFRKKAHPGR